jgi:biopolymer transport protein TolR
MRRPRKAVNQINVVPYIDVMLVLLVIFMVTAPLVNPGTVDLPSIGEAPKVPVQPLEVTLKTDKTLLLQDRGTGGPAVAVSERELIARVKAKIAQRPDQPVVIAADKDAIYQDVLHVLDILRRNGATKAGLMVQPGGR